MSIDLQKIPPLSQRQDSVSNQLADLQIVANRLGMYDAADAIQQWCDHLPVLKYGCHCEVEYEGEPADDCVLDDDNGYPISDCIFAKEGMRKEQCENWKIIRKNK